MSQNGKVPQGDNTSNPPPSTFSGDTAAQSTIIASRNPFTDPAYETDIRSTRSVDSNDDWCAEGSEQGPKREVIVELADLQAHPRAHLPDSTVGDATDHFVDPDTTPSDLEARQPTDTQSSGISRRTHRVIAGACFSLAATAGVTATVIALVH